ncbi:hypothetical protein [Clostridium sp.]|uniref:hypothetical protein n=1 Tax=Clostridium sp. TaxID=1506 RepID=UPI003F39D42A
MENANRVLLKILGVLVFISAISLYISMFTSLNRLYINLKYYNQERTISQKESPPSMKYATGGDILNAIYKGLETDIEIDGYVLNANIDITRIDLYKIDFKGQYRREIEIIDGKVNKVYYYKN